jgi:lipoprotein-releasing system ATP-binding protein
LIGWPRRRRSRLNATEKALVSDAGVELRGVSKVYETPAGPVPVLDSVDFSLAPGANAAILGPSGSGKSTLLHLIGALDTPTAGVVRVAGVEPSKLSEKERAGFRNRTCGFIFQEHHLLPQCSVLENVLVPTIPGAGVTADARRRAEELLERVGLGHRLEHRPAALSGGERQRVAIARSLINEPKVLLGDEPTGNLDHQSAGQVIDLLLELHRQRGTVLLLVTHSRELAARLQRRVELRQGRLVELT